MRQVLADRDIANVFRILNAHGISNVSELAGGIAAWEQAKLPVEGPTA